MNAILTVLLLNALFIETATPMYVFAVFPIVSLRKCPQYEQISLLCVRMNNEVALG